ncbi:MAG: hypothetical protein GKS01_16125 [Alphaproteobacteria bacterium]|nr:hypothetical protein [Alphaproteobacteria bacterium]
MKLLKSAICIAMALGFVQASNVAHSANFKGKTIRIVINFAAGGPTDIFARHYQTYLSKFVPGNPTVIVENRPGAAGIVAANFLYNRATPDGLTIGTFAGIAANKVIAKGKVKYDLTKFNWLGAVPQTQILVARNNLGVSKPTDLLKSKEPLVYGTSGINPNFVNTRLFLELMGVKFKAVFGYRGQARAIQALRRDEINITDLGISGYLPREASYKQEGVVIPVLQRGIMDSQQRFTRVAALSQIPTMEEALRETNPAGLKSAKFKAIKAVLGAYHVQFGFVVPPKTPKAVIAALRKAYADMFGSAAVKKESKARFKVDHQFVDGPSAQRFVTNLVAGVAPDVKAAIRAATKRKGKGKRKK